MTKKWKDTTSGGHTVKAIAEHPSNGLFAGAVQAKHGAILCVEWLPDGRCMQTTQSADIGGLDLVPAEPEVMLAYATPEGVSYASHWEQLSKYWGAAEGTVASNLKLGFVDGKLVSAEVIK